MRPISQAALARSGGGAQRLAWLLSLAAEGWTWRGATLPVTLGADPYPARLDASVRWSEKLPETGTPGGLARADAEVRVLDLPGGEASLRDRLAVTPPVGLAATLLLAWLDDENDVLAEADAAVLLAGRVTAWRIEPADVTLTLLDELNALANRHLGRLLHPALLAVGSPSFGKPLPWIFGRVEDAELLPLDAGVVSRLAADVDAPDRVIPLVSLDGFPTFGRVQINAEMVNYSELDPAAATLGSLSGPVWRGAPVPHPRGTAVRWVPPAGFTWLVADHPCRAIESVRADGVTVSPRDWTAITVELDGIPVQAVTIHNWPLDESGCEATRLTATVQGLAGEDGTLLENPAHILNRLLTDPRLAVLAAGRLDAASFDQAAAVLAARGYRYARRLTGGETLGELLESAAREAGLWIIPAQPIGLIQVEPTPQPAAAENTLDAGSFLGSLAPARISAPAGLVPPDAVELVGVPRTQGRGRPSFRFPPEAEAPGALPRRFEMGWLDLTRADAAGDLGELLWAHLGDPPFELEQEFPPGAALLGAGATIRLSSPALDLIQALAWVESVESAPPARVRLRLRGPWAGAFGWQEGPLNFIRRYAFGNQLVLVLAGVAVARVGRAGVLRLRGRLREDATLDAGPFPGPVALSGGKLYLNYLSGTVCQPFLALDAGGNAELAGRLRERSTFAMNPAGQTLGAGQGRFWLSPDAAGGALEFEAAAGILHLKSRLIENLRL